VTALVVGIAWLNFQSQPNNDFTEYYCAGQIVRTGQGHRLYDLMTQFQCETSFGPVHVFFYHPAWESLLFVPFTFLGHHAAYFLWTLFSIGLLIISTQHIESRTKASCVITAYTRVPADLGLLYAVFLTFAPVTTCLLLGQDSMLMLLIYTLVFVFFDQKKAFLAGFVLAFGLYKFQAVVPFVLILALSRQRKALAGFATGALIPISVSLIVGGAQSVVAYPRFLLTGIQQNIGGFNPRAAPNIRGLLTLALGDVLSPRAVIVLVALTSILILWWMGRSWKEKQFRFSFAGALLATVLASFHLYNYELSVLLLPISIVCSELARYDLLRREKILLLTLVPLFIAPLHRLLSLHDVYALMCVPILSMLWITQRLAVLGEVVSGQPMRTSPDEPVDG